MKFKERATTLKTDIPAVYMALRREDTPISAKVFAAITIGYALSPIDLIPDFIPVLGYLDDLIILPLLVALTIKLIPEPVFAECREQAKDLWADGKPQKWYYAIPIVLFWAIIIYLLVKVLWL